MRLAYCHSGFDGGQDFLFAVRAEDERKLLLQRAVSKGHDRGKLGSHRGLDCSRPTIAASVGAHDIRLVQPTRDWRNPGLVRRNGIWLTA